MLHYLLRHKTIGIFVGLAVFLALFWLWSFSAYIRGDIAARIDLHRGGYQILGYGLPPPSRQEYVRCLRERYKIEFHVVAGCIVSESLVSYVDGYDSVVAQSVNRRFGRDVFKECVDEADRTWKAARMQ